ncbi:hypothetical protein DFP72DRAFT_1151999 [Ephemerocybe angulata]|uniref:Uncharacterized protein n=1 Tax=Ephemerocybe angulata TaxID=980116 RepID=A0A8H6IAD1_9AGAR|nr:hypothetical protein DFP72DRAFT_1151999 [Tulosesus angulatus]
MGNLRNLTMAPRLQPSSPPSVPFDFSCEPQAHWGLPQLSTPSSSPSSSPPYPPPSVEASRLAISVLVSSRRRYPGSFKTDLHAANAIPLQALLLLLLIIILFASTLQVPERSSTRSDGTAASAASHLVLDSQPPAKRARHGHGSAGPATEPSSRRIRRRGRSGSVSVGALARSGSQPHSATESLPVAGSSAGSMLA